MPSAGQRILTSDYGSAKLLLKLELWDIGIQDSHGILNDSKPGVKDCANAANDVSLHGPWGAEGP